MKKNRFYGLGIPIGIRKKMMLKMKMVLLFTLLLNFSVSAVTYSQLNKVSLNMANVSLEQVFLELRRQTDINFFYSIDKIKDIHSISIKTEHADLNEVLDKLLKNTSLTYSLFENVVVIKDKPIEESLPSGPVETQVEGNVKDQKGNPLPGVTIRIKGTSIGTVTDDKGDFKLALPQEKELILVFSFVGMQTQEIVWTNQQHLKIVLEDEVSEIDEVVVTGYFQRKKDSYTGAATTWKGEQLRSITNQNMLTALSMLDPSFKLLDDINAGSDPNHIPDFQIRGAGNISGLQEEYQNNPNMPTFILDGFEVDVNKIFDLDPNRVESITILKDAAATAIYGSRAANGVVVVETKSPEAGRLRISYTFNGDFEAADLSDYHLLNAEEKLEYERRAHLYDSESSVVALEKLAEVYNQKRKMVESGINTNWLMQPVRKLGFGHKHSLLFEGGDDKFRYGVDLNYNKQVGVMKGSYRDRLGIGIKLQYNYKTLKFQNNLTFDHMKNENSPYGNFSTYAYMNPYYSPYDENGNYKKELFHDTQLYMQQLPVWNPLYNVALKSKDQMVYDNFIDNFVIEWNILDGLKATGKVSVNKKTTMTDIFKPADHTDFADETIKGSYYKGVEEEFSYDVNAVISYVRQWEKHLFNLTAVYNVRETNQDRFTTTALNYPNDKMAHIGMGLQYPENGKPSGYQTVSRLMGIVGNINYGYDDRYLFDFSVRSDGSSQFGANKRWGTFWAVGAGWNIHKEKFFENSYVINELKLRGSYGYTGNQNFYPYQAMMMYEYTEGPVYSEYLGTILKAYGNRNLKWQRTEKANAGLDFALFNRRLSGSVNVYREISHDVLVDVTMPPSLGFDTYKENLGKVRNQGYELSLRGSIISQPQQQLYWNVFGAITRNQNKLMKINDALTALNEKTDEETTTKPMVRYQEGASINTIWVNKSLGIDPMNGNEVFEDKNGNKTDVWSSANYIPYHTRDPKAEGNFGTMVSWKGLELNAYFYYKFGGYEYNSTLVDRVENVDPYKNVDRRVLYDRWQNPGDIATFKGITDRSRTQPTSRFVEKDNVLQLKSLNLAYTFDPGMVKKLGVERLKLIFYANDVFRKGSMKAERGINYPFARHYALSLQVTL